MSTPAQARLLRHILEALGLSAVCTLGATAGCGSTVDLPTGSGGGGGASASSDTSTSGTSTTTSTSSGTPTDCTPLLVTSTQDVPNGTCPAAEGSYGANLNCFTKPAAPATCADFTTACILDSYSCGFNETGTEIPCGPFGGPSGQCCYVITGDCAVGRPFLVAGDARLANLAKGSAWSHPIFPNLTDLDSETRAALAEVWAKEALFEHASIASFARFTMELLSLGAPGDLVLAAQRAMLEEHEHARVCFGLASAYAGTGVQPGALDLTDGWKYVSDMVAVATSLAREGCVAETVAALQVKQAADEASDPAVKAALLRIAEQEAEHAALSWRALAWLLSSGDQRLRSAVQAVFDNAERHVSIGVVSDLPGDTALLRAHGYLPIEERLRVARRSLGEVVGPAAVALLQSLPPSGSFSALQA